MIKFYNNFFSLYKASVEHSSMSTRYLVSQRKLKENRGDVAVLVGSHMNGLKSFESTIEQTTETMPPSHETITAAAMTLTNRITSLRELLPNVKEMHHANATLSYIR